MSLGYVTERRPSPTLGLQLDRPPWEVDRRAFVVARNLRTFTRALQTIGGKSLIATAADNDQISFIGLPTFFSNFQVGVVGTNEHLYQVNAGVLAALNAVAFHAAPGAPWEMAQLLNRAYFVQPSDPLQFMGEDLVLGPLTATAGAVPRGYTMTDFYNHLILANVTVGDPPVSDAQSFIGSGRGKDQFWNTVDLTQESRTFLVPMGNDPILCIRKFGDYMVVYKRFSIHLVSYNPSNPLVYAVEAIASRTGTVGTQAVVYVPAQQGNGDQHYFVGQDNIYLFDGSARPIGQRIWDDFKKQIAPRSWNQIVGWYHQIAKEVYFGFVSVNSTTNKIDTALVYDILNDSLYYRDWPFTAGGYMLNAITQDRWIDHPEDWQHILPAGRPWVTVSGLEDLSAFVGDQTGKLFQYEALPTSDFAALAQTGLDDAGDESRYKTCEGMRIDVQGLTKDFPLEIWGRGLDEIDQYLTKPFMKLKSITGGTRVDFYLSGRWFDYQFRQAAGGSFRLNYWEPSYTGMGDR